MFITRINGTIYGCWAVRQGEGQEELPDDHPETVSFLAPKPPADLSDIDNLDKVLKAFGRLIAQYTGKTPLQVRQDFMTIYRALP